MQSNRVARGFGVAAAVAGVGIVGVVLGVLGWGCSSSTGRGGAFTPNDGDAAADAADGASPTDAPGDLPPPPPPIWTELSQPEISLVGGAAPSVGGTGRDGGLVNLLSSGGQSLDPTLSPLAAPVVPDPATVTSTLSSDAFGADIFATNGLRIEGAVTTSGTDSVRTIQVVSGDLYVSGTLRGASLGGARQSLVLEAPGGTVYVTGAIDTSGAAGAGEAGGAISISAQQVVITGTLSTAGGAGVDVAGPAGTISIVATGSIDISGAIDSFGGDASGDGIATTGGHAGDVTLHAGGHIALAGTLRLRGGAATATATATAGDAQAGDAATLHIDASGDVQLGGRLDGRGGIARSGGSGRSTGGAAGALQVGATVPPSSIAVLVPLMLTGGDGAAAAGKGGSATLSPAVGDVTIAGAYAIDASGGGSSIAPGAGGLIQATPRYWTTTAGVHVSGGIAADGGSIFVGGSGNGADAGRVLFQMAPQLAPVLIDPSATISVNGGTSGGAGVAGGGGHVFVWTNSGDLTHAGTVLARGGTARDTGGTGGLGGFVYFFSDGDHNALTSKLGDLLIAPTGLVDASGGAGTIGGSARSDGIVDQVPVFPENQESISIFVNCDGVHGDTLNWLDNQGHLIARGGPHGGNGGDIVYHGISPTRNAKPPSGNIDTSGDGSGKNGDFRGE